MNWAAGWNMAGYSPDPDNVWVTDDYSAAVDYVLDTLERWFDQDESMDHDDYLSVVSEIEGQRANGAEVHALLEDATRADWHLWVVPTDQPIDTE